MKNRFVIFAAALMLSASAASCGHEENNESSAPDLPILAVEATEAETTEEATEETTSAETEVTTEEATEATTEKATKKTDKTQTTKAAENNDKNNDDNSSSEPEPDPEPTPDPVPDEPQQEPSHDIKFGFDKLDSYAGDVISALGDPIDVTSAPACFANGADSKIYTYENIVIECYVLGGEEKICVITITGGDYSTYEGIRVGSSQSDVESAYGSGETAGEYVIYYDGDKELDVKYDNGSVCELMYYLSV